MFVSMETCVPKVPASQALEDHFWRIWCEEIKKETGGLWNLQWFIEWDFDKEPTPVVFEGDPMVAIPKTVAALTQGSRRDIQQLLIAAILDQEDEMLEISEATFARAAGYKLLTTVMEDGKLVLVAEPR